MPSEHPSPAEAEDDESLPVFARVWRAYNKVLHEKPIMVKSATSFVGFLVGDVLAQNIVGRPFDVYRTLRLVLFGVFMDGPVGRLSTAAEIGCTACRSGNLLGEHISS